VTMRAALFLDPAHGLATDLSFAQPAESRFAAMSGVVDRDSEAVTTEGLREGELRDPSGSLGPGVLPMATSDWSPVGATPLPALVMSSGGAASLECALCSCVLDRSGNHKCKGLVSVEDAFLAHRGLTPAPAVCPSHTSESIELMCTYLGCKGSRFCCSICLHGVHKGHVCVPIKEAVRIARDRNARAAYGATAETPAATPPASFSDIPAAVALMPFVLVAQRGAVTANAEFAVLKQSFAAAQVKIDDLCDATFAAGLAVCSKLGDRLMAFRDGGGGRLQSDLAVWDALRDRSTASATVSFEVSSVPGPANAAHQVPALYKPGASLRDNGDSTATSPCVQGYICIAAAATARIRELAQALRDSAEGAMSDKEEKATPARPASAAVATTSPCKQYIHAPVLVGPVVAAAAAAAAAEAGDAPSLMRLLDGGALTEEEKEECMEVTQADIDAACDVMRDACLAVRANLSGQLEALGNVVGRRLQSELAAWDGLHDRSTASATDALEASVVLGPANAALHLPALYKAVASLRGEIEEKKAAPRVCGYVGIAAAAAARIRELTQALRDAAEGAVSYEEEKVTATPPAAAAAATTAPCKHYNHIPALVGPVMAAAKAGNVITLMRLLDGGASTEEKCPVSGRSDAL
jgi:hypothetical protein